jgi:hypothetical protein
MKVNNGLATQLFPKRTKVGKRNKSNNYATSQQWHKVEDKLTGFVPRWVKIKNNLLKN